MVVDSNIACIQCDGMIATNVYVGEMAFAGGIKVIRHVEYSRFYCEEDLVRGGMVELHLPLRYVLYKQLGAHSLISAMCG